VKLETKAEKDALLAQELSPFRDVNVLGIKAKVAEVLALIGRSGIFAEYSLHDVSHVDKMLGTLDWLVPVETRRVMTPADWLLVVLATYFHDVGMLVTEAEFAARSDSDFDEFCEQHLFEGDTGTDYKSKVASLGDEADRFLYQEYIRYHHAGRIGDWIRGHVDPRRGVADDAAAAISKVLAPLPSTFKQDLAIVCESHHLEDLFDTDKYPTAQPYGDSDESTANVQYAALLLRSADLLHITADRTPSIMFRLINPQDPVSQREWAKQSKVRRVKSQKGRDSDGNFSIDAPQTTIEVHATFEDADAFFGLTSYLGYVENQLQQVMEWAEASAERFAIDFRFPWRTVDTSRVLADGFSPKQLSFTLDQARILDLLTGHTIYNDISVVLRELVQNALDAVRLQAQIDHEAGTKDGHAVGSVTVEWDSESRELVVRDTGTGMNRSVIEKNLLKAGASRYQEERFRKRYPEFSPISRFGIGVLSAFMISDSVTITTYSPDEPHGHQLTLRSVHGKYLLRLLDKHADCSAERLAPHGTEVRLSIRQSAELPDVEETIRRWVVIPRCKVTALIDGETIDDIGFASPKEAVRSALEEYDLELYDGNGEPGDQVVDVVEKSYGSVRIAFAVRWSRYFREWSFLTTERVNRRFLGRAFGTCVEGIRVEAPSPGFLDFTIVAIADARGANAPKTNVARVGLDATVERREMLRRVYRAYLSHIAAEADELQTRRSLSMTWAGQEAELLLKQLLAKETGPSMRARSSTPAIDQSAFKDEMKGQALLLVESEGTRSLAAATTLTGEQRLWTVDSALVRAAERILREIPADGSLNAISSGFETDAFRLPDGITLVGYSPQSVLYRLLLEEREVAAFSIRRDERRVDVGWDRKDAEPRWVSLVSESDAEQEDQIRRGISPFFIAVADCEISGGTGEIAIRAHGSFYLVGESPLRAWLLKVVERANGEISSGSALVPVLMNFLGRAKEPDDIRGTVERIIEGSGGRRQLLEADEIDVDELVSVLEETPLRTFDTLAWMRRDFDFV
jgi:hypothetical protein